MSKLISTFVPVDITIEDDGKVIVRCFPGDLDTASLIIDDGEPVDDDVLELLDSITWDDPKTWIAL